jgi:hypothetical protein
VARKEALAIVERDADIGVARELPRVGSDLGAGRREEVERRAGPEQHAHVDASRGGLGEQLAQHRRRLTSLEREVGRRVPARDAHRPARATDRLGDRGQHVCAVDEHVDRAAVPRRRCLPAPRRTVVRGFQRVEPPEAP